MDLLHFMVKLQKFTDFFLQIDRGCVLITRYSNPPSLQTEECCFDLILRKHNFAIRLIRGTYFPANSKVK